ncbi:MAG: right-handed parallel beta-helix repeat-containing protein [Rhodanobacteraceae bacterium]|nr:right-handed parallel beta-helix repeat-containing protein [Rhodanobacteraceae bacterium]
MRIACFVVLNSLLACAEAADYYVGPAQAHTTLQSLLDAVNLAPGDVVHVEGNRTYGVGSGVIVRSDDGGTVTAPVVIRGERMAGQRPVLSGGINTIKFQSSDHIVFEGFEVTGGTSRCIFHDAHDVTIRDVLVRDCPNHGIHSADLAGSLTVEYSELHHIGGAGNDQKHAIYAQTGELEHPGAVFRLRHSYLHDGLSGNLVKSRAQRTELHYNWIEGAHIQEVEMLSPDPDFQENPAWSDATAREDGEMVGNVVFHRSAASSYSVRLGGDGTGAGSAGYYRLVGNTFIVNGAGTVLRLFAQLQSVDAHNNVFTRLGGGGLQVFRDVEADWVDANGMPGVRQMSGSGNFVDSAASAVPGSWISTYSAPAAGFVDAGANDFSPNPSSPLLDHGTTGASPAAFPFPAPLGLAAFQPRRGAVSPGFAEPRPTAGPPDIGAYERTGDAIFVDGFDGP